MEMKQLFKVLEERPNLKIPKHEKSASVDSVIEIVGLSKKYNYKYWLAKIGKIRYNDIQEITKNARNLPDKYSKGGYITNRLDELNGRNKNKRNAKNGV